MRSPLINTRARTGLGRPRAAPQGGGAAIAGGGSGAPAVSCAAPRASRARHEPSRSAARGRALRAERRGAAAASTLIAATSNAARRKIGYLPSRPTTASASGQAARAELAARRPCRRARARLVGAPPRGPPASAVRQAARGVAHELFVARQGRRAAADSMSAGRRCFCNRPSPRAIAAASGVRAPLGASSPSRRIARVFLRRSAASRTGEGNPEQAAARARRPAAARGREIAPPSTRAQRGPSGDRRARRPLRGLAAPASADGASSAALERLHGVAQPAPTARLAAARGLGVPRERLEPLGDAPVELDGIATRLVVALAASSRVRVEGPLRRRARKSPSARRTPGRESGAERRGAASDRLVRLGGLARLVARGGARGGPRLIHSRCRPAKASSAAPSSRGAR